MRNRHNTPQPAARSRRATHLFALLAITLASVACKSEETATSAASADEAAATQAGEGSAEAADEAAQEEATTLTVYSGRSEPLVAPAIAAFEEASGVEVEVNYADTSQLAATLLEEGERTPADVFVAQDASTLALLAEEGVFASLPEPILTRVPPTFRGADGAWVAVTGRARVLAYNTESVSAEELPESVDELTSEAWKGRVGWAPENASFQSFVAAMVQLRGEEAAAQWVQAMQANEPRAYPSNTPAVMAVSRGEIDVALTNHYYLYRLKEEHGDDFPVANHYFKDATAAALVNVTGAGVLEGSDNAEAAREFVQYLLSDEGQAIFVEGNHEFPTAIGAPSPDELPGIETLNAPEVDLTELSELETTVRILRDAGALP